MDYPDPIFTTDLDQNLDAHGWFDRAKELMADDYYYQAQGAAVLSMVQLLRTQKGRN